MNIQKIRDAISTIAPDRFSNYLTATGWLEDGKVEDIAGVWHRPEPSNYSHEVIQPKMTSVRGYFQRLKEALDAVALYEQCDISKVIDRIQNFFSDLVKVRVEYSDVKNGSIPLDDGVLLVEKARDLLVATTMSAFKKQRYFSGNRSQEVQDYIDQLRLGQTEVGSFVVNVLAPISHANERQQDSEEISVGRAVTINLARSLSAMRESILEFERSENLLSFEGAVQRGASANLCDALIGLSGISNTRDLTVTIRPGVGEAGSQEFSLVHYFEARLVPYLKSASEFYKGNYVIKNYQVSGVVTGMKHQQYEDFGIISVRSLVNGTERVVSIQLEMAAYWDSLVAHAEGKLISCVGDLNVNPRSVQLLNPSKFTVDGVGGLFDT